MTLPRDLSGDDLARVLTRVGYVQTRQTGSHMRLTTQNRGEHHGPSHVTERYASARSPAFCEKWRRNSGSAATISSRICSSNAGGR